VVAVAALHWITALIDVVHCITFFMGRASSWERKVADAKRALEAGE
jgi:hypothetical protein